MPVLQTPAPPYAVDLAPLLPAENTFGFRRLRGEAPHPRRRTVNAYARTEQSRRNQIEKQEVAAF